MWRQAKVTVGDQTADQAFVNFADNTAYRPEWVEWPERVAFNSVVKVGTEKRYAGEGQAIGGQFHIPLMLTEIKPAAPEPADDETIAAKKGAKK